MSDIKFTGERYIPSETGIIRYEHLHRYFVCLDLVVGKSVVDIACGEGYGSYLLAGSAESVIGIDIEPECISHAKKKHNKDNLTFLLGSCDEISIDSQSVDIVISFETIEHHDKHEEMISEIKRILKPSGVLIISSPNRLTYSDIPNYQNPFHVKELYYDELSRLLNKYFKCIEFYGQKVVITSLVLPLGKQKEDHLEINCLGTNSYEENNSIYFISICSNNLETTNPITLESIFYDSNEDIIDSYYKIQEQLQKQLHDTLWKYQKSQSELEGMKRSSFWKLRNIWFKIKNIFGSRI